MFFCLFRFGSKSPPHPSGGQSFKDFAQLTFVAVVVVGFFFVGFLFVGFFFVVVVVGFFFVVAVVVVGFFVVVFFVTVAAESGSETSRQSASVIGASRRIGDLLTVGVPAWPRFPTFLTQVF